MCFYSSLVALFIVYREKVSVFCHGILRFIPGILLRKCCGNPAWCIFFDVELIYQKCFDKFSKIIKSIVIVTNSNFWQHSKESVSEISIRKCLYFVYKIFGWSLRKAVFIVVTTMLKQTAPSKWCYCSENICGDLKEYKTALKDFSSK